ncbi:hypothetical protein NIE88_19985 [Sporolactobacillus shoreicorticis]|uniref:Uncharacterized protein n=1 Tax=Sporolactobacillus shoreicorticis TaxID=1923877 RepID=A0ABW5RZH3_9BACL|nr:hypothetical protein [Sporolactobacillus shoreicorticis]MCO7128026.1 hypothetical protein [Sporolactobacillus shoreicorticis]
MRKPFVFTAIIAIATIAACFFGYEFQEMAYWTRDSMFWYWVGAVLSYLFSAAAIIFIIIDIATKRTLGKIERVIDGVVMGGGMLVAILTILWTTFVIIAGQSEM